MEGGCLALFVLNEERMKRRERNESVLFVQRPNKTLCPNKMSLVSSLSLRSKRRERGSRLAIGPIAAGQNFSSASKCNGEKCPPIS
ncbi:hypothetical protein DdX_06981 [Ditylenchus destructor]|uniref:Uncharacterized protein n=1 Tax=Ditylenchus destructor TaxID=166010 RepID=A0AAD4N9G4_9BILA|nr:hypothetical protein DdX_06981 [Ditylenchus destructor]